MISFRVSFFFSFPLLTLERFQIQLKERLCYIQQKHPRLYIQLNYNKKSQTQIAQAKQRRRRKTKIQSSFVETLYLHVPQITSWNQ